MISAFALLFSIHAQTVTITAHAERLDTLLSALSVAAKAQFTASPELSGEIVAVSLRNAPLDEVEHRLADVLDARWVVSGAGHRLERFLPALEAHRLPLLEARKKVLAVNNGRLLNLLGHDAAARLVRDVNVTFSTDPQAGEFPLPESANSLFASVRAEDSEPPPNGDVLKTTITVSWYDCARVVTADFTATGTYSGGGESVRSLGSFYFDVDATSPDWDAIQAAGKVGGRPIPLSPLTVDFATGYRLSDLNGPPAHPTPQDKARAARARNRLAKATEIDPLWFASDLLIAFADATGKQFIGSLPDRLTDDTLPNILAPVPANELAAYLKSYASSIVDDTGGWISVRPRDPDFARANRADRKFLNEIGAVANGKTPLTLDLLTSLVQRGLHSYNYLEGTDSRVNIQDPVTIWASMAPYPSQLVFEIVTSETPTSGFLRFWRDVPPNQRSFLIGGGRLPLAELPPALRGLAEARISFAVPVHEHVAGPTAYLTFEEVKTPRYLVAVEGEYSTVVPSWGPVPIIDIDSLADALELTRDSPRRKVWEKGEVRVTLEHAYTFTVHATDGFTAGLSQMLYETPQPEEPIPWRQLPPDLLKQLQASIDRAHTEYEGERIRDKTPP